MKLKLPFILVPAFFCFHICMAQTYFDSTTYYFFSGKDTFSYTSRFHIPSTGGLYIAGPKHSGTSTDSVGNTHIIMQPHINYSAPIIAHYSYENTNAGMLSREIIENPQSITFVNLRNQNIVLQMNMNINDSCLLVDYDSLQFYAVRLTNENRFVVNTDIDIERYLVHCIDTLGFKPNHPFHNLIIEISKGMGIVTGFSMATFPFHANPYLYKLVGFTSFAKQVNEGYTFYINPLTRYNVGDTFHWKQEDAGQNQYGHTTSQIQKVIAKDTSRQGFIGYIYTTETYTLISRGYNMPPPPKDVEHLYSTDTLYYNLSYIPAASPFEYFPRSVLDDSNMNHDDSGNVFSSFSSIYNINEILKVVGYGDNYWPALSYDKATNSWQTVEILDPPVDMQVFYGIGITPGYEISSINSSDSWGMVKRYFVYVRKNDTTWGTPFPFHLSIDEENKKPLSITIYPNPAQDEITITSLNKHNPCIQLFLTDITGKLIHNDHTVGTEIRLPLPPLTAGVYFVTVIFQNRLSVTRKLIIN
jgi:hypothetical protein